MTVIRDVPRTGVDVPACLSLRAVEGNGVVVFTDDNHLTASFSRSVAPVLGERIAKAM
jgi:hypothetical protein